MLEQRGKVPDGPSNVNLLQRRHNGDFNRAGEAMAETRVELGFLMSADANYQAVGRNA